MAVASGSAVSVLVIDCSTMGCAEPMGTPPTSTVVVVRRVITNRIVPARGGERVRARGMHKRHRMGLATTTPISRAHGGAPPVLPVPDVAVLEDDASLAELAAEMCEEMGLSSATYDAPRLCLDDFEDHPPRVVILDWRLTQQIAAAVFRAVRHRFPDVPSVCWTATPRDELPSMVWANPMTRVVSKDEGVTGFETAVRWALGRPSHANRTAKGADR